MKRAPADAAEGLLLLGVAADQDLPLDLAARLAPRQHILQQPKEELMERSSAKSQSIDI